MFRDLIKKIPFAIFLFRFFKNFSVTRRKPSYLPALGFYFVGTREMESGSFELLEVDFFNRLIKHKKCFVNVGANFGFYACKSLKLGIPTIAIEASPQNFNVLLNNVQLNKFSANFSGYFFAASDRSGTLKLYGNGTSASLLYGWAGESRSQIVPANCIDAIDSPINDCLIWMDIEGAELAALRGAQKLLNGERNVWVIEINISDHQPKGVEINPHLYETFELMSSYGYVAYLISKEMRKVSLNEIKEIAEQRLDTLDGHNFVFLRPSDETITFD